MTATTSKNTSSNSANKTKKPKPHFFALTPGKKVTKFLGGTFQHIGAFFLTQVLLIKVLLHVNFLHGSDPAAPSWLRTAISVSKKTLSVNSDGALDAVDEVIIQFMLASLSGYLLMGFICLAMDLLLTDRTRIAMKAQGEGSKIFSPQMWFDALGLSLRNLFFVAPIFTLPLFYLPGFFGVPRFDFNKFELDSRSWRDRYLEEYYNNDASKHPSFEELYSKLDFPKCFLCFIVHGLTIETVFYWTHRLIHYGKLYVWIHKKHHRFTAPVSVASMYAHWAEFMFGNLAGVILGPYITGCHPFFAWFWICMSLVSTGGAHSGYYCFAAKKHDHHHEKFLVNFGVIGLFDRICGTRSEDKYPGFKAFPDDSEDSDVEEVPVKKNE